MRHPALRVSWAALALAGAAACAATGSSPPGAPAAAALPPAQPRSPVRYGAEGEVSLAPAEASAIELVRRRLSGGGPAPRVSSALVLAARELARAAADGAPEPLARGRVRAALVRAGAHDASPAAVLVEGQAASSAEAVAGSLPRSRATHIGAGEAERGGAVILVLLASERRARLSPFPGEVAPGARAVLSGTLGSGLARPRVFVTLPSGRVREADAQGARDFRAELQFPSPGRYAVEVIADGEGGPEVAALLAVSAGGAPLDPPRPPAASEPTDDAEAEAAVMRAVNATRRRQGLAPLAGAPELAALARRHSAAMAAAGAVAHVLPGSGDVGDRLRRAGVAYRRVYENVARAAGALAAHEAAEESPAHLGNVLRPDATRAGVGIARGRLPSGDPTVYLTEVFVAPPDDGAESRLTADGRVREALWGERDRLGLAPLTADAALDALAREAAEGMRRRDDTEAGDLGERALSLRRSVAAVDVFIASAPAEAVRSANLRDGRLRRVGVGVATGDSRRYGAGRFWIAVVYTD